MGKLTGGCLFGNLRCVKRDFKLTVAQLLVVEYGGITLNAQSALPGDSYPDKVLDNELVSASSGTETNPSTASTGA